MPENVRARFAKRFTFDPANQIGMTGRPIRETSATRNAPSMQPAVAARQWRAYAQCIHPCRFETSAARVMIAGRCRRRAADCHPEPNLAKTAFSRYFRVPASVRQTPEGKSGRGTRCADGRLHFSIAHNPPRTSSSVESMRSAFSGKRHGRPDLMWRSGGCRACSSARRARAFSFTTRRGSLARMSFRPIENKFTHRRTMPLPRTLPIVYRASGPVFPAPDVHKRRLPTHCL